MVPSFEIGDPLAGIQKKKNLELDTNLNAVTL
jgi:hypothetical protein